MESVYYSEKNDDIELLLPESDVDNPIVSIVIPALNEELTIEKFIDWCKAGLHDSNVEGEILIVDSSTDRTGEIAVSKGARVLKTPKRGLGRAYIDAISFIRGKYVILGDCDCTYDFRNLKPFIEKFDEGCEYIMGTRFKGSIEKNAMPKMHQYFGSPVTNWIFNRIYHTKFSDIHCGMRGITNDALERMSLKSQSWEYASEMIIKSKHMKLKTCEVPISFYKDINGRVSNLKRNGWTAPWQAGWISLKAMFIYGADFFLKIPGLILIFVGLLFFLPINFGSYNIGPVTFSLGWMLLWLTLTIVGIQSYLMSILAECLYDYSGDKIKKWVHVFSYNRSFVISVGLVLLGIALSSSLIVEYYESGFSMPLLITSEVKPVYYYAVSGILGIIAGFQIFTFTLILHSLSIITENGAKLWKR